MAEKVKIAWKLYRVITNHGSDLESRGEHLAVAFLCVISTFFNASWNYISKCHSMSWEWHDAGGEKFSFILKISNL
jgi:hypothetical protein